MKKIILCAMLMGVVVGLFAPPVLVHSDHEADSSAFKVMSMGSDRFYNWDFDSQNDVRDNVDWPVTTLFYNNATVNRAKELLYGRTAIGSSMHFHGKDQASWFWDSDRGTKSSASCLGTVYHMRIYGEPDDDDFYSSEWGFYVLGTTHIDYNECGIGRWHGDSETAEEHFNSLLRRTQRSTVTTYDDHMDFHNHMEEDVQRGRHRVNNNGELSAHYVR